MSDATVLTTLDEACERYCVQEWRSDSAEIRRRSLVVEPAKRRLLPYLLPALQEMLVPMTRRRSAMTSHSLICSQESVGDRVAFEDVGGRCVFTSEWDKYSEKTYRANFPATHEIAGDDRSRSTRRQWHPDA